MDDTPSLDTSFHDHEMDTGGESCALTGHCCCCGDGEHCCDCGHLKRITNTGATVAEMVAAVCNDALSSFDGVRNVDWNDLGEVTIVTSTGTFRGTFALLADEA